MGRARLALMSLLLVAGVHAGVAWQADSQLTLRSVEPPIRFEKGEQADEARYFRSFDVSPDGTSFTAEVKPRAGADMVVTDVLRLVHSSGSDLAVRLSATSISNAYIEAFEWHIRNGTSQIGTLDHLEADPEAEFTLPPGMTFTLDLRVDLAEGAGKTNAGIAFDMMLEATP